MKRLITGVLWLWFLLVLSLSMALAVGHVQPTDPRLAVLHLADCEFPCWLGIIAGQTSMNDAAARIMDVFSNVPDYSTIVITKSPPLVALKQRGQSAALSIGPIWILASQSDIDRNRVGSMLVRISGDGPDGQPTLADIVNFLGPAARVVIDKAVPPSSGLLYGNTTSGLLILTSGVVGQRLDLSQHVDFLLWFNDPHAVRLDSSTLHAWRGFASLHVYKAQ